MKYFARIYPDEGAFSVEFADCPGCLTFGSTREKALANAKEALEGWLEAHLGTKQMPPMPTTTEGEPVEIDEFLARTLERRWG